MSITAAFTNYNRTTMLFEAVAHTLENPFISEVVISDDASEVKVFTELEIHFRNHPKVKLFRNDANRDCFFNKRLAVERSTNEWVALLDSDNLFDPEFFNRIENLFVAGLNDRTIYQPEFAKPEFDFTKYQGLNLNSQNVGQFMEDPTFETMLNAANNFFNRSEFLRVFDGSLDPVTSDSIFHNYNWLKSGNSIYVVPYLQYTHRIHEQSHYKQNVGRTSRDFHSTIVNKLKRMK